MRLKFKGKWFDYEDFEHYQQFCKDNDLKPGVKASLFRYRYDDEIREFAEECIAQEPSNYLGGGHVYTQDDVKDYIESNYSEFMYEFANEKRLKI